MRPDRYITLGVSFETPDDIIHRQYHGGDIDTILTKLDWEIEKLYVEYTLLKIKVSFIANKGIVITAANRKEMYHTVWGYDLALCVDKTQ